MSSWRLENATRPPYKNNTCHEDYTHDRCNSQIVLHSTREVEVSQSIRLGTCGSNTYGRKKTWSYDVSCQILRMKLVACSAPHRRSRRESLRLSVQVLVRLLTWKERLHLTRGTSALKVLLPIRLLHIFLVFGCVLQFEKECTFLVI